MYGFNENTRSEGTGSSMLPAGKNPNVFLTSVKFDKLKDDSPQAVLQFYFEDKNGASQNHVEFPVDPDRIKQRLEANPKQHKRDNKHLGFQKGAPVTVEDQIKTEAERQGQRIKHIATKFMPEDKAVTSGRTWEEFAQSVLSLFASVNYKDVPLELLLGLNNEDYPKVPLFPPFLRRMDDDTELVIDPNWVRVTPLSAPTANPAEAAKASDPFGASPAGDPTPEKSPF